MRRFSEKEQLEIEMFFKDCLIFRSKSDRWDEAKEEWKAEGLCLNNGLEDCFCENFATPFMVVAVNKNTGARIKTGMCCSLLFPDMTGASLFKGYLYAKQHPEFPLSVVVSQYCLDNNLIDQHLFEAYNDIKKKSHRFTPTDRQLSLVRLVNNRFVGYIRNNVLQKPPVKSDDGSQPLWLW